MNLISSKFVISNNIKMGNSSSSNDSQVKDVPRNFLEKSWADKDTSPRRRAIERRLGLKEAIISPGVIVVEPVPSGILGVDVNHHGIYIGNDKVIGFSEMGIRCHEIPRNITGTVLRHKEISRERIVFNVTRIWEKS